ncbi:YncE family protein [Mesobacillus zeae]|uniref:WD40 repeat domain-containing protein n=1 Tax=Mesobacillus zeae TaxID=1917180 RepID=A0A398B9K6_9BACI|nr:WD40 repeat domain-containing protein [Mesobacillus zeae]RID85518.1 WD40 repeat domain-containing protein [Mesobacillus zeae]
MKPLITLVVFVFSVLAGGCSSDGLAPVAYSPSVIATMNIKDMSVSFIDISKRKNIAEWDVEKPYNGGIILPDGDTLLLYGKTLKEADLYSMKKGEKTGSWKIGKGVVNGLLLSDGKEIVFSNDEGNTIDFYSTKGKQTGQLHLNAAPLTLLESGKGDRLFAVSFHDEKLNIINPEERKNIRSFPIHASAAGAVLNEKNNEVWVGGHGKGSNIEQSIHVYDIETGKLKKQIHAPEMPVNFTKNGSGLFVLSHGSSTLYKLDTNGAEHGSLRIGANPFEVETVGNILAVAGYDSDDIYLVDPENLKIEARIKVGKGPFQIVKGGK